MSELLKETLSNHLGLQLFHWAVSQSDLWHLAHRCAEFVNKLHEPLERGAAVLDNILTLEEEEADLSWWLSNERHSFWFGAGDMNQQIPHDDYYDEHDIDDGKCNECSILFHRQNINIEK